MKRQGLQTDGPVIQMNYGRMQMNCGVVQMNEGREQMNGGFI